MDNYGKQSDGEINRAVRLALHGGPVTDYDRFFDSFPVPDYCSSPADAWPIIVENRISILSNRVMGGGKYWQALDERRQYQLESCNKNKPLRAAMIVFLKMQSHKNG